MAHSDKLSTRTQNALSLEPYRKRTPDPAEAFPISVCNGSTTGYYRTGDGEVRRNLALYAALMDEAAMLIETIPPDVFDAIKGRYPLCDELGGAAAMAKDDATALRSNAEVSGLSTRPPC